MPEVDQRKVGIVVGLLSTFGKPGLGEPLSSEKFKKTEGSPLNFPFLPAKMRGFIQFCLYIW